MTNVLCDFHHSDLLNSLHLLFERMGAKVYVPYGLDWFEQGIWRQGHAHFGDAIARQFLLTPEVDELHPERTLNLVTLAEAREMDWAVVMCSVPDNEPGYHAFAQEMGARYAVEVGNVNQWVDHSLDPVILDSTGQYPGGVPFTPEFDLDAFHHRPPIDVRLISSFVNLFPGLPCYGDYTEAMALLPSWRGEVFGHHGPSGFIKPTSTIAALMRASAFGWHDKVTGDGFGFVIHYWAAVGRPLIGHASHYAGQTADDLWVDGETCIDLDRHSIAETAEMVEAIYRDRKRHAEMSAALAQHLRSRIDFPADAQRVAEALGLLVPA